MLILILQNKKLKLRQIKGLNQAPELKYRERRRERKREAQSNAFYFNNILLFTKHIHIPHFFAS